MPDLADLLAAVPHARLLLPASAPPTPPHPHTATPQIRGLSYDSRKAKPGDLFFCVPGQKEDGLRFLPDAVARGAVAAVVERKEPSVCVPAILVPSVRTAMPLISARFYDYPSRRLTLIGVTGTNGKTTTT